MPTAPTSAEPPGPVPRDAEQASVKARRPEDVIDDIGLGLSQWWNLLLVGGVSAIDGMELALVTLVTDSTQHEFHLANHQCGMLTTFTFAGVLIGCLASGWGGDCYGRRSPILASYALVTGFGILTIFAQSYWVLLLLRFAVGFGSGLGMPPAQVMMSELVPSQHRMLFIAGRSIFWCTGQLYATFIAWCYDPHLAHVNWRALFAWGTLPAALLGAAAFMFLRESPIFLAATGDHAGAEVGLVHMRALNKRTDVDIEYSKDSGEQSWQCQAPLWFHLRVILGPYLLNATLVVLLANFTANAIMYGHAYGEPLVLVRADDSTAMLPTVQLMIDQMFAYVGCATTAVLGAIQARKVGLSLTLVLCGLACCGFPATLLASDGNGWLLPALMQVSLFGLRIFSKCVILFAMQCSSDIYPTASRTLGASIVIGLGRFGAVFAPLLFVAFGPLLPYRVAFYYFLAALAGVTSLLAFAVLPHDIEELQEPAVEDAAEGLPLKSTS